jgi:DNA-binding transcriptional LysR family regulator
MIRIYADELDCIELVVRDGGLEVYPLTFRAAAPEVTRRQVRRRSVGLVTAAVLVAVSAGAGYFVAPRVLPAHARNVVAAAPRWPAVPLPPASDTIGPAPSSGSQALLDALSAKPTVTQPQSTPGSGKPPGVAAFGLQP